MRLSVVRKILITNATPLTGFARSNDEAIRLAESEIPEKAWCLVRDWVIYDVSREKISPLRAGLQPTMVYADTIVRDEQNRWESGEWVRSSPLKSFTLGCLFETDNTVYVLLGEGHRAGVVG